MRTVTVILDEQEVVIKELRSRQNAEWRRKLEEPFQGLVDALVAAPDTDLTDGQALARLVRSVSSTLLQSMDMVTGLLAEYAPELRSVLENAYDSEILDAFVEVLKLAYPFGGLLERLRGLGSQIART